MPPLPLAKRPLTELQLSTLAFMRASHASSGQWPRAAVIARAFGVDKQTIRERLTDCIIKGAVRKTGPGQYVVLEGAPSQ